MLDHLMEIHLNHKCKGMALRVLYNVLVQCFHVIVCPH